MQLSSSSISAITPKPSIIEDIDFQCASDSTTYPTADKLRAINKAIHYVTHLILEAQDEADFDDSNYTDFPIYTTSLVADQQDYALPDKTLKIQRVEISYDGTTWVKVEPFDIGESSQPTDATSVEGDFSTSKPYYDVRSNSVFFFPIPQTNVTNGLKMWTLREPDEFTKTDTTQEPGFAEAFHPLISYIPALEWLTAKKLNPEKQTQLREWIVNLVATLKTHYGSKNKDRHIELKSGVADYR